MKQRRTLIKGIGVSLPAIWATPEIQSVVLPAHAQTSASESSAEESSSDSVGCGALLIPGNTVSCPIPSGITVTWTEYGIDDSATCPAVHIQEAGTGFPSSLGSDDVLRVQVQAITGGAPDYIGITVQVNGENVNVFVECGSSSAPPQQSGPVTFESSSGATYQADFTITATSDGGGTFVTLSDITLMPI